MGSAHSRSSEAQPSRRSDMKYSVKKPKPAKDKNAPKKPSGAYMWFCADKRPALREKHPDLSITDIAKELGAAWKKENDEAKKAYYQQAEQDKQRYAKELARYDPVQHKTWQDRQGANKADAQSVPPPSASISFRGSGGGSGGQPFMGLAQSAPAAGAGTSAAAGASAAVAGGVAFQQQARQPSGAVHVAAAAPVNMRPQTITEMLAEMDAKAAADSAAAAQEQFVAPQQPAAARP